MDLLKYDNNIYTSNDLENALIDLGYNKYDDVCVHSSIFRFGTPLLEKNDFLKCITDILINLNKDTLLMPTFTYSYCKNQTYDVDKSNSTVGLLTNYFRKLPNVTRTLDPLYSFALTGNNIEKYLNPYEDVFGKDSIYNILLERKGVIVLLGDMYEGHTYYHHIECMAKVPYRYYKTFNGTTINKDNIYQNGVLYFVRDLEKQSIVDLKKLVDFLIENKLIKTVKFGAGIISLIDYPKTYTMLLEKLLKNPNCLFWDIICKKMY